jgi:hypothetical protein
MMIDHRALGISDADAFVGIGIPLYLKGQQKVLKFSDIMQVSYI